MAMKRREFITLGGAAVAWPAAARGQSSSLPVIGILNPTPNGGVWLSLEAAFRQGLSDTGYTEGRNVRIEGREADGQYERLPALAADLIQHGVAAIVAGGNLTGVTVLSVEVGPKLMELLHAAVPSAKSMALLINPRNPNADAQSKNLQTAAQRLGLQLHVLNASTQGDFDPVFERVHELKANALMIAQDVVFNTQTGKLADLSVRYAIPAIYPNRDFAEAGGLMSYGTDLRDAYRQAGIYAGRILKGEKPADLPVIQASKFELIINLKTARTIGLTLSADMLSIADEVIE